MHGTDTRPNDLDSHKVRVTFFEDAHALRQPGNANMTLPELADLILKTSGRTKLELRWLKLAAFGDQRSDHGCWRTDANLLHISGIELDYDGLKVSFENAVDAVKTMGVRCLVYTSPSYNAETWKWRLLIPLSKNEPRAKEMREIYVARVNGFFKKQFSTPDDENFFSGETFTLSQSYFYGRALDNPTADHQAILIDGPFLDLQDGLFKYQDIGAKVKPKKKDGTEAHGFEDLLALIGDGPGHTGFHENIRSAIASYVATHGPDLDREALKVRLRSVINDAPKNKDRKRAADIERYLSDRYLDDLIESGIKKFGLSAPRLRIARALPWRETKPNGFPVPSMHNARLAITDMGIECSYDIFHIRMLFGYKGEAFKHELGDEITDNAVIRLRQIVSDRYYFDFTERHTRDAVISLALEHCFDPVCDMLDQAEAAWDGVKRLDRMAVNYFNSEDTPLNCAFLRKTMIAGVHRARVPGCKFDNIIVLEGPEGWNKSTAIRVLAGDDNFSDERIIGKESREVQEQLATIWIHENADLAGLRKAEVEQVKAFASRTTDIARAAYGHFVTKQKRHSIEMGSTNNDRYMQSQTGNRRFWPLKLLKSIDLDKLRRDRLQLWGEAAKYEHDGESVVLDEALYDAAAEAQEKRRVGDAWEIKLADIPTTVRFDSHHYEYPTPKVIIHVVGNQERVATLDLLEDVLQIPNAGQLKPNDTMRLSNVMKTLGWQKTDNKIWIGKKQVRGFFRVIDPVIARIKNDPGGGLSRHKDDNSGALHPEVGCEVL